MLHDGRLLHISEKIARRDLVADLDERNELPLLFVVEIVDGDPARDPVAVGGGNARERTLDPVEDAFDESRRKLHREGRARALHSLAGSKSARLFIDLNGRPVSAQFDDLADELFLAHPHHVVHFAIRHVLRHDERTGYFYDLSLHSILR